MHPCRRRRRSFQQIVNSDSSVTQEFQIVEEENINPQGVVINEEFSISTPTKEESNFSDEESRASNEETCASRAFNMRKEEE